MSLNNLVKYPCSKNHNDQEVIEANCHVIFSHLKTVFNYLFGKLYSLFNSLTKKLFTPAIYKIPLSTVHNYCNKEKDAAAKWRT